MGAVVSIVLSILLSVIFLTVWSVPRRKNLRFSAGYIDRSVYLAICEIDFKVTQNPWERKPGNNDGWAEVEPANEEQEEPTFSISEWYQWLQNRLHNDRLRELAATIFGDLLNTSSRESERNHVNLEIDNVPTGGEPFQAPAGANWYTGTTPYGPFGPYGLTHALPVPPPTPADTEVPDLEDAE